MEQMVSTIRANRIILSHVTGIVETVLVTPVLEALRAAFPEAAIEVVASIASAPVLARSRVSPRVWTVGHWREGELLDPRHLWRTVRTIRELQGEPADLLIELLRDGPGPHLGSQTGPQMGAWLRACLPPSAWHLTPSGLHRERARPWERWLRRLWPAIADGRKKGELSVPLHRTQEWLRSLEPLGVRPVVSAPRLRTDPATDREVAQRSERVAASRGSSPHGLLIGLGGSGGAVGMDWTKERVVSLARRLAHHFDARILLLDDPVRPGFRREVEPELRRAIPGRSIRIPARLSFDETLSSLARLSLLVAPLGPIAHLAAAVGTPVVAITRDATPGPLDLLSPHTLHVRPSHGEFLADEERVYDGACQLLHISRAELLSSR